MEQKDKAPITVENDRSRNQNGFSIFMGGKPIDDIDNQEKKQKDRAIKKQKDLVSILQH